MSQRMTNTLLLLLCENLKNRTNEFILMNSNRLTDIENKLVVISEETEMGRNEPRVWNEETQTIMYK